MQLCFVTNNKNKLLEVSSILQPIVKINSLDDIGFYDQIPETGSTLEENSLVKAKCIYDKFGMNCFADDTGLEIDALDGDPGVYSARYAGLDCNADDNINLVLNNMKGVSNRKAIFRTVITLFLDSEQFSFEGRVDGKISLESKGNFGFGYDPIFVPNGFDNTFGEMRSIDKNKISHRKKAINRLSLFLDKC